jgi:quinol monooxygenase YgiN
MIILGGTIRIAEGSRDEAFAPIIDMVNATRAEPGCIQYAFAVDVLDDHLIRIFEVFQDEEALTAHRASAHMATWRGKMAELGIHGRDMSEYQVLSAKKI